MTGADYVIISVLVGGYEAIEREIDIPKRYGVDQAIGDTLTPGGIMRCLRTLPQLLEIGRDVMTHCPDAWVLNYTNPMAMLCWGMNEALPGIRLVGLCHSVQHTTAQWAHRLKVPLEEVEFECAGLNHQAWIFRFEHQGRDLLPAHPRTRGRSSAVAQGHVADGVHQTLRFPVTEASGHNSEYSAWFRKRPELIAAYCPGGSWNGGSGFIKELYNRPDWRDVMEKMADGTEPVSLERSNEYGSQIVSALAGGDPVKIYGNVMNEGHIANLPDGVCVEVPCSVDAQRHRSRSPSATFRRIWPPSTRRRSTCSVSQ